MLIMDRIGGVRNFECEVRCKDGRQIWLSMNIRAIRENGAVVRYEGMCEDISTRKKMELRCGTRNRSIAASSTTRLSASIKALRTVGC